MVKLTLTGGSGSFSWTISGLSVTFNTSNYIAAGITKYQFTQGDVSTISGIVSQVKAKPDGLGTSVSGTVEYDAGTYSFWGWAQAANGRYYPAGSGQVTVASPPPPALPDPTVTFFSASPESGTLKANCSWTIANSQSGISYELRAIDSNSYPSSLQYGGWTKGTFYATSGTAQFDKSGTFYIWVNVFVNGSYVASGGPVLVTTSLQKPIEWSWSWGAANAFSSNGAITNLTQTEWNNFIERVNQAVSYYNASKGGNLTPVSPVYKMSDKTMYATSFTGVCSALNTLCWRLYVQDTTIASVSKGDTIYGHYFTDLSGALNRAIGAM